MPGWGVRISTVSTNDEAVAGRLLRLPAGTYEQVETLHVRQQLAAAQNLEPGFEPLSDTALPHQLAVHVGGLLRHALTQAKTPEKQVELVQRVIAALGADYAPDLPVSEPGRPGRLRTLQEIRPAASPVKERLARPATPLSEVALLTNAVGEPSIGAEIRDELAVGGHDVVDSGRCQRGWRGVPAGGMRPMVVVVVHPHRQGLTPSLL